MKVDQTGLYETKLKMLTPAGRLIIYKFPIFSFTESAVVRRRTFVFHSVFLPA